MEDGPWLFTARVNRAARGHPSTFFRTMNNMTIESLNKEIGRARGMYRATGKVPYAEKVARLERFKSLMISKAMVTMMESDCPARLMPTIFQ
jgi:hypothetical protein